MVLDEAMDAFDIGRLTDFDFELVCKDLFEEILGVQLEVFTPGADQGIDLRYISADASSVTIIQCKHLMRTGRAKLLNQMRNRELPKIRKLNPARYILASSVELTAKAKESLVSNLSPYVKLTADIYGIQEIESELRKRPHIVQRHLRLWLSSTVVLQSILAKEILVRSSTLKHDIEQSLRWYVPSESFNQARNILDELHSVVISGAPGVGKTTLAQVLLAEYSSRGFSIVEISADADEANKLWMEDEKQIFYYDDFLGQTTLEDKLNKNEDSRLLSLLRRVQASPSKRFILTTREYILAQARQRYEKISRANFTPLKYVLDLTEYTSSIRAQILYNHVYFSDLPAQNKAIFAEPREYQRIIAHHNFNPRVVNLSVNAFNKGESPKATVERLYGDLQNPRRIWEHIIEYQLDADSVSLIEVLFSLGESPTEGLRTAWLAYGANSADNRIFRDKLQLLEGTLIRVVVRSGKSLIDFYNPSVRDYMISRASNDPEQIARVVERAVYFEQLQTLWTIAKSSRGGEFMSALVASNHLQEGILRTINSAYPRDPQSSVAVRRANFLIELAEKTGSSNFLDIAENKILDSLDIRSDLTDGDEVAHLIKNLATSKFEVARQWAVELIESAIDFIVEYNSDLESKDYASSVLATLDKIEIPAIQRAVESARSSIEESIFDEISNAFDEWKEGRREVTDMEQVVEYASNYIDPAETFSSYASAAYEVSRMKELDEYRKASSNSPKSFDHSSSVQEILGSLKASDD